MMRLLNVTGARAPLALLALVLAALLVAGCGGGDDDPVAGDTVATTTGAGALQEIEGRSVSAGDDEIVLRTADGERSFLVRADDRAAVDPEHFASHAGVPTLGFRVFYVTDGGVDYAVSVEEIAGSTLGFD